MNADLLIIAFPLLPIIAITIVVTVKYLLQKDISQITLYINAISQLICGLFLVYLFKNHQGLYTVVLSEWKHSIELSIDSSRIYFLLAFLIPSLLTIFSLKKLIDFNIRIIFLFYLAGCSGVILSGDIFNFYIFYEVMIMAAYVLIAVERKYYASIKYMIFGAVSSAIFLAGIIMLYASGSYFSYRFVFDLSRYNTLNVQFVLLLFSLAFLVKSAFFPVSGWVSTCHSATNSIVSSYLSSFTIFTGIFGLFYFVIQPAAELGYDNVLTFIKVISILTMLSSSLILFFEPEFKRCIAGSTVFTVGFIGLLMASGAYQLALFYLVIHALYKSYLFLIYDDLVVDKFTVYGNRITITAVLIMILFTVGFFPTIPYFIKYNILGTNPLLKIPAYIAMTLMLGSFFKFKFKMRDIKTNISFYLLFPVLVALSYSIFPFRYKNSGYYLILDFVIALLVFFFAGKIYKKTEILSCIDTKYLYININYELLYVVILIISQTMTMRFFH